MVILLSFTLKTAGIFDLNQLLVLCAARFFVAYSRATVNNDVRLLFTQELFSYFLMHNSRNCSTNRFRNGHELEINVFWSFCSVFFSLCVSGCKNHLKLVFFLSRKRTKSNKKLEVKIIWFQLKLWLKLQLH